MISGIWQRPYVSLVLVEDWTKNTGHQLEVWNEIFFAQPYLFELCEVSTLTYIYVYVMHLSFYRWSSGISVMSCPSWLLKTSSWPWWRPEETDRSEQSAINYLVIEICFGKSSQRFLNKLLYVNNYSVNTADVYSAFYNELTSLSVLKTHSGLPWEDPCAVPASCGCGQTGRGG